MPSTDMIKCLVCGDEFVPKKVTSKYCGTPCYNKGHYRKRKAKLEAKAKAKKKPKLNQIVNKRGICLRGPGAGKERLNFPTVPELQRSPQGGKAYMDCKLKCHECGFWKNHHDWERMPRGFKCPKCGKIFAVKDIKEIR